jgi:hypothetical protein
MDRQFRIDDLIGLDLMRRTSLSIDFGAQEITLGPVTHTKTLFPFYGRLPIIPVSLWVGSERLRLLLDTGAEQLNLFRRKTKEHIRRFKTPILAGVVLSELQLDLRGQRGHNP